MRRKFLERDVSVNLNDLLITARAQEAVDLQMVVMGGNDNSEQVNNATDTGLNGNVDRRNCFNCGRDDHFARDRRCPARGRKCDQCGEIGHFIVKCRRGTSQNFQQWERRGIHSRGRKIEPKITDSGKKTKTNYVDGNGDRTNSVKQGKRPSTGPECVISVGDDTRQSNRVVTQRVGSVYLPNVLIDSRATSNLLGKPTWEWLKTQRIQCKTRNDVKIVFAYGNTKPLPTLGTFTAHVMYTDTNA